MTTDIPRAEDVLSPAPPRLPARGCEHTDFAVHAEISRITDVDDGPVTAYAADIRVECIHCGTPFLWTGVPTGLSAKHPTVSIDGQTLIAPMRPHGADPAFGTHLTGFTVIRQIHP